MSSGVARLALVVGLASAVALSGPVLAALTGAQRNWYAAKLADHSRSSYASPAGPMPDAIEPVAETLVQWDRLRREDYSTSFSEISNFLRQHPGWPLEMQLRRRAERLIDATTPPADRLAFFAAHPPLSAAAKYRAAEAWLATGRRDEAVRFARQAWISDGLPLNLEAELTAKFFAALTPEDHYARADRLLWSGQSSAAIRMGALIPESRRALIDTRLALKSDAPGAAERLAVLSPVDRTDPGLLADQANWLRRGFQTLQARALLADTAIAQGAPIDPVRWMQLRREVARSAAADGQYDLAYRIAANHRTFPLGRPLNSWSDAERDVYTDLEFLAGWTALKTLNQPARAVDNFQNYRNAAKSPLTQARGDYWAGRAAEAAGSPAQARRFYESAARHPDYFFGQLAGERLDKPLVLPAPAPIVPSTQARQKFEASELVKAARLLGELGDRSRQTIFLKQLVETAGTLEQQRLVADLSPQLNRPDLGVLVAREARNDGELALLDAAYPRLSATGLTGSPSLVHAITRQESRFDRAAISPANARGLMQLMPATAAEQAGKLGLPYDFERLLGDEQYNATLGSAYLQRLIDRWGGNVMLAVASYNAGAGNVNKWIRANGDPRDPNVDVIDWIERIPFTETRIYVWRVLENAVMYDMLDRSTPRPLPPNRLSSYLGKRSPG